MATAARQPLSLGRARRAADQLADRLRLQVVGETSAHPVPVDVVAIARRLGIHVDLNADIRQDGRLIARGGRSTILVRRGDDYARQRFSVAHELGHWLINHRQDPAAVRVRQMFKSEETMCNVMAASLLLPSAWLQREFPDLNHPTNQHLAVLSAVARAAHASHAATAIRLRTLCGWERTLLQFVRTRDGWVFDGEAAVFPREQGEALPGAWAGAEIEYVRVRGARRNGVAGGVRPLPMLSASYGDQVEAEILAWDDRAVALIASPRAAAPSGLAVGAPA